MKKTIIIILIISANFVLGQYPKSKADLTTHSFDNLMNLGAGTLTYDPGYKAAEGSVTVQHIPHQKTKKSQIIPQG